MAQKKGWICDGIPKDGKEYPDFGGYHTPYENDTSDCEECGLPQESSIPSDRSGITKTAIVATLAVIIAIAGGSTLYAVMGNKCEPGLEKNSGQCIDPFQPIYQEATQKGDEAIRIADNYQTVGDLEQAEPLISSALNQMNEIPTEALVYPEVAPKLEEYDKKRQKISYNLGIEKAAQQKLKEVSTIDQVAQRQTEIAETTIQLIEARQKWHDARNKLQDIERTRLSVNRIQKYQSDFEEQIALIDEEISRREQEKRPARNLPTNTYVPPKKVAPPRQKPYIPPQKVFTPPKQKPYTPPKNKPAQKKVNPVKPKTTPSDPCAVKNPPPNCLF